MKGVTRYSVCTRQALGFFALWYPYMDGGAYPVDAGIITVGCDWNPAYPYLSGRKMLMLSGRNSDESIPQDWIGSEVQFIATCIEGIDPATATGLKGPFLQVSPNIWKIFS